MLIYILNAYPACLSYKVPGQIVVTIPIVTFRENASVESRVFLCGQTDRHDEANSRYSFCERP
jgi:hypothetical protein